MTKVYFEGIKNLIIDNLSRAESHVYIAVAWFTNEDIFNDIIKLLEKEVSISLIILNDFINNGPFGLDFEKYINKGGKLFYSNIENPVHHKFCVIDQKTILTGSYNWTYYAEHKNYENIVEITDKEIIKSYISEYEKIIHSLNQINQPVKYDNTNIDINNFFDIREYYAIDLELRKTQLNKTKPLETNKKIIHIAPEPTRKTLEQVNKNIRNILPKNIQELSIASTVDNVFKNKSSLGISARVNNVDDRFSILINKDSELPITQNSLFHTVNDNQTSISVNTHKGENEQASKNPLLGKILIKDLPPLPAGKASIKVTFSLSKKGELKVSVLSNETGNMLEAYYYNSSE